MSPRGTVKQAWRVDDGVRQVLESNCLARQVVCLIGTIKEEINLNMFC